MIVLTLSGDEKHLIWRDTESGSETYGPRIGRNVKRTLREKLNRKTAHHDGNSLSCDYWLGATNEWGHGHMGVDGISTKAHIVSYLLNVGDIPDGLVVRHTCRTPSCVRPDHLILGTRSDNARDMDRDGMRAKRRISNEKVQDLRKLFVTGKYTFDDLSARFEITPGYARKIAKMHVRTNAASKIGRR